MSDPTPWDQIIVISQGVINKSFKEMYELASDDDGYNPIYHYTSKNRLGALEFWPDAQWVQLQVTKKDPMLFFYLPIKKGTLGIYTSDDPDNDEMKNFDLAESIWVFPVTIKRKSVEKGSAEYTVFQKRSGLPNSVFSLERLYVDASSSTKMDPDRSTLPYWNDMNADERSTVDTYLQKWLNKSAEAGCNILGYSAQAEDDELNKYAPSFPPTSIDYFCYPYNNDNPKDDQDNNGLSYLMMSNGKQPPVGQILNYSGHWVDGTNSVFCMNQELFWPWLFPVLRDFAASMTIIPTTPYCQWDNSDPDHPFISGMRYKFGDDNYGEKDYQFTPSGGNSWSWDAHSGMAGLFDSNLHTEAKATNPDNSNDWMELTEYTGSINGKLSFTQGGEGIALAGASIFFFHANHRDRTETKMTFTITWSLQLAVSAVEDGGLIFTEVNRSVDVQNHKEGGMSWNPPSDEVATEFKETLTLNLNSAFSNVEYKLLNALRNQHRLFLPGKGSFLMKDPIFNGRGDLHVQLEYNGADPPPPPQH